MRKSVLVVLALATMFFLWTSTAGAVNSPPVCDANGPYIAECGSPSNSIVTLDGSGSTDPDGDPLILYEWDLDGDGQFDDATGETTPFLPLGSAGDMLIVGLAVTDIAGAVDACDASVAVIDTTAPDITCPANISIEILSPGGATVAYPPPSATDTCDASVNVTCDPLSGSTFPVGTTSVTCTATDASGNVSACGFDIELTLACVDPAPLTQGYWHRQCLGVPAGEGGLDPGRNGRGPSKVKESDFADALMPAADAVLASEFFIFGSCSEGMDADPPSSKCERAIKQYTALVFNQLSDRVMNSCGVDLSPWGCTSTNVGDLLDELAALINTGDPQNCKLAAECAALVNEGEGLFVPGVQLNEIRTNQPSFDDDEYFELTGPVGTSLSGLAYLVIGDPGSGAIEAVVDLSGQSISPSGFFVAAEDTFTLGVADLTASLNFENGDNVTHMLVSNFSGSDGDDLDTNDDGVLDVMPWDEIVDCVALVGPVSSGGEVYCSTTVGPDSIYVPAHAYLCPGGWVIGPFDPVGVDDTPGTANICDNFEACCLGDGSCLNTTPADCSSQGGSSQGSATTCEGVLCPQ